MSNIEDDVKAAIEEFGDLAFERFEVETAPKFWISSTNNSQLITAFARLKPLPELLAHDIKVYGDNAYLMWSGSVAYDDAFGGFYEVRDVVFDDNAHVLSEFEVSTLDSVYRKTSSALPFDLERAKDGDVVEVFDGNPDYGWSLAKYEGNYEQDGLIIVSRVSDNYRMRVYDNDLRMKFTKQVQL